MNNVFIVTRLIFLTGAALGGAAFGGAGPEKFPFLITVHCKENEKQHNIGS